MQTITTTELRTKSSELIRTLLSGQKVELTHRAKFIAIFKPVSLKTKIITQEDIDLIAKNTRKLNLPKLTYKQMEKNYREHLMKKYGKNLSRRKRTN